MRLLAVSDVLFLETFADGHLCPNSFSVTAAAGRFMAAAAGFLHAGDMPTA